MIRRILFMKQAWGVSLAFFFLFSCPIADAVEKTFRIGVVPQFDARRIQNIWRPILKAIEKQSGVRLVLVGSANIPKFEQQFLAGELDFAYMNPYHLLKANESQGYTPLVRDVGRKLYGIVVARKDSSIQSVLDLEGKTVAFPAPNALGAALIPRAEFQEKYKIHVQAKYVKSHSSVYLNVATGLVAAGGGVQKTLSKQPDNIKKMLKIIYKTSQVAPHPVAVHARVAKEVKEKVLKAFLHLGETVEGRELLGKIPMKKIGTATLSDYEPLHNMGLDRYFVK